MTYRIRVADHHRLQIDVNSARLGVALRKNLVPLVDDRSDVWHIGLTNQHYRKYDKGSESSLTPP